jgi:DNA-binding MltR family transcriptional regulator
MIQQSQTHTWNDISHVFILNDNLMNQSNEMGFHDPDGVIAAFLADDLTCFNNTVPKNSQPVRRLITVEAHKELMEAAYCHPKSLRMSKMEEDYFMAKYGLTQQQVRETFNNKRQRLGFSSHATHYRDIKH